MSQPDIENTLKERGARYGTLTGNGTIAQGIKEIYRESPNWKDLPIDTKEALDIIASKIARILTGDPDYVDNFHDIIGYARLVEKRILEGEFKITAAMR